MSVFDSVEMQNPGFLHNFWETIDMPDFRIIR